MKRSDQLREACGVFGVFSRQRAALAPLVYYGLYALQHRGQESAGIAVNDDGVFRTCRDTGLVSEVFSGGQLDALGEGNIAVGHVRYATTGTDSKRNIQPLLINHRKGRMVLAHNGNLVNSLELRTMLEERGSIFHTTTDSEVIAYIIVQERLRCGSIEQAVAAAMDTLEGAYSLVIFSPSKLIAARDRHGFRPLCMGMRSDGTVVFASETCALDAVGAAFVRDTTCRRTVALLRRAGAREIHMRVSAPSGGAPSCRGRRVFQKKQEDGLTVLFPFFNGS